MAVNVPAIAILLVSFLVMILLRFPIAYSVALSSIFLPDVPGPEPGYRLPADGQRHQLVQPDGRCPSLSRWAC